MVVRWEWVWRCGAGAGWVFFGLAGAWIGGLAGFF